MVWAFGDAQEEAGLIALASAGGIVVSRRCSDAPELLSICAVVPGIHVLVSARLPRMSGEILTILTTQVASVAVIAFDDREEALAHSWNASRILRADHVDFDLVSQLRQGLTCDADGQEKIRQPNKSQVIACWGPVGSHGRTTYAIGLAEAIGKRGARVLLIDADTVAPSISISLGIDEDVSGIVVAARYAEAKALDSRSLANCVKVIGPNFWVMTGLSDPSRWPELRAGAIKKIIDQAREYFDYVVIDLSSGLDEFENQPGIDLAPTLTPRRMVVNRTVLENAEQVFLVTRGDVLGAQRLANVYSNSASVFSSARKCVVVNMVNKSDSDQIQREFGAICGVIDPRLIVRYLPSDSSATDMLRKASTLGELNARGGLVKAIGECADSCLRGRENDDGVADFSPLVKFLSIFRSHANAAPSGNG